MDMAAWLWERVERRDAPTVLAHALSLAPTRDALLRHAALTEQWDHLAVASTEAADVARHVGWSRSGPDAVAAICHWISADRTLRRIPPADRAAPLAAAALAAWAAPGELADRLAATEQLSTRDSATFEHALSQEAAWLQSIDDVEARLGDGPDASSEVLDDDQTRSVLVRHAARTGEWEDLLSLAVEAQQNGDADESRSSHAHQVAQLSAWMTGHGEHPARESRTRAEIAEILVGTGWIETEDHDAAIGHDQGPGPHATPAAPTLNAAPESTAGR